MTEAASSPPAPASRESLELVHHHPGRLRVRAEAFRGADVAAAAVRQALESMPGVIRFAHNERTGSVLVEYQPGLAEPDQVLARIADAAGLPRWSAEHDALARRRQPAIVAIDAARELNAITYELTGWRADLRSVIPAGLAALAAYSFVYGKEDRLPRWDNLLYWSYTFFRDVHVRDIGRSGFGDGADRRRRPPR